MPESGGVSQANSSRLVRLETTNQVLAAVISIGVIAVPFFLSRLYTKLDKIDETTVLVARMDERLKNMETLMENQQNLRNASSNVSFSNLELSTEVFPCQNGSPKCLATLPEWRQQLQLVELANLSTWDYL